MHPFRQVTWCGFALPEWHYDTTCDAFFLPWGFLYNCTGTGWSECLRIEVSSWLACHVCTKVMWTKGPIEISGLSFASSVDGCDWIMEFTVNLFHMDHQSLGKDLLEPVLSLCLGDLFSAKQFWGHSKDLNQTPYLQAKFIAQYRKFLQPFVDRDVVSSKGLTCTNTRF